MDPVKVDFGNESIWFTQTHIAEIRELMALKDAADEYKEPEEKTKDDSDPVKSASDTIDSEEEKTLSGTDVYKDYIGKRIQHAAEGYGVVTGCDGKYLDIQFEKGAKAGKTVKYSLEACLSKGLIKVL